MLGSFKLIGFVPTTDFARAKAFYVDVLGLRFIAEDGFALVVEANGNMVRIAKVADLKPAQFTVLGWQVSGIETVVASLEKKGVKFERYGFFEQDKLGIWTTPNGDKVAWFKDPDGNTLSVSQHV